MSIFERQVLDFMGYMWLCIALNFVHVICIILAIFGALQHRIHYVIMVKNKPAVIARLFKLYGSCSTLTVYLCC